MHSKGQSSWIQTYHPHELCHPPGKTEGRLCFVLDLFIAQTKDSHTLRTPASARRMMFLSLCFFFLVTKSPLLKQNDRFSFHLDESMALMSSLFIIQKTVLKKTSPEKHPVNLQRDMLIETLRTWRFDCWPGSLLRLFWAFHGNPESSSVTWADCTPSQSHCVIFSEHRRGIQPLPAVPT